MNIDEILKIGKVEPNDENKALISKLKPHIEAWLQSDKFASFISGGGERALRYCDLPYPPLLDPDVINYASSDIKTCWALNIPLPPFYDFMIFGSHAVSLHSGVRAFLELCGCGVAGRQGERDSYYIYEQFFGQLKALNEAKKSGKIKRIALIVSDLSSDNHRTKLYSLMPANALLHIVRDPISNIKSLCNLPIQKTSLKKDFFADIDSPAEHEEYIEKMKRLDNVVTYYKLDSDLDEKFSDFFRYQSGANDYARTPSASACDAWIRELHQAFHDGILARLLIRADFGAYLCLETSDFVGERAVPTMKNLACRFGFDEPKSSDEWLFKERVSDYKKYLPAPIMLGKMTQKGVMSEEAVMMVWLASRFHASSARVDISHLFGLDRFFVVEAEASVASRVAGGEFLAELREFLPRLAAKIQQSNIDEKAKYVSENDVLDYFKNNFDKAELFEALLFQHLRALREHNPAKIEGFKYYKKFLEILAEHRAKNGDDGARCRLVQTANGEYFYKKLSKAELESIEGEKF